VAKTTAMSAAVSRVEMARGLREALWRVLLVGLAAIGVLLIWAAEGTCACLLAIATSFHARRGRQAHRSQPESGEIPQGAAAIGYGDQVRRERLPECC
jgi:hypothetical protein